MEDPHGRIAVWFTLLAEYNFEICYRTRKNNGRADYLSSPIRVNLIMSNAEMGSDFKVISNFLNGFSSPPRARILVES